MTTTQKLDLYKLHQAEYATPKRPVLIQTQPAQYLAIAGVGEPGGPVFTAKIGALYGIAFTVKMTRKFAGLGDYAVCKLEGQWFFDDGLCPAQVPRSKWRWKLLIRTPDFVGSDDLKKGVAVLLKRGKDAKVKEVRLESLDEGLCVQMLHVGPYDKEGDTVAVMKTFAESRGYTLRGPHHEIYLSDPRRVAPERLRTILREPLHPQGQPGSRPG
jgi:hypothetical protein